MRKSTVALLGLALFVFAAPVWACLWDYDTLSEERRQFPTTLELITGKFLRHSREFYEWRVRDRQARLQQGELAPNLYDDLAVAYEKLGDHEKAIETILQKEQKYPGRYETYANLGTFYIHAGQFDKGIVEIDRAIAINPDAHFGREIYQKHLVNYVLSRMKDGAIILPLEAGGDFERPRCILVGFVGYLEQLDPHAVDKGELDKALKGVLGMMRFGNYDSPVLLEALGDILSSYGPRHGAKRMAARAYLMASYAVTDESIRQRYRQNALGGLDLQTVHPFTSDTITLEQVENDFQAELREAEQWYKNVRNEEISWIQAGLNPELEFAKKYNEEPAVAQRFEPGWFIFIRYYYQWVLLAGAVVFLLMWVLLRIMREFAQWRQRRRRAG